jgi:hypothetical protein
MLLTTSVVALTNLVNKELVVRLLKAKLLLTEVPLPVNWKPLILLTNMLLELMKFVKRELVVRLVKAKLLLTELTILPFITIFEDVIVVIDEISGTTMICVVISLAPALPGILKVALLVQLVPSVLL